MRFLPPTTKNRVEWAHLRNIVRTKPSSARFLCIQEMLKQITDIFSHVTFSACVSKKTSWIASGPNSFLKHLCNFCDNLLRLYCNSRLFIFPLYLSDRTTPRLFIWFLLGPVVNPTINKKINILQAVILSSLNMTVRGVSQYGPFR